MATKATPQGRARFLQMLPLMAAEARKTRQFIDGMTPQTAGLTRFECRHVERLMDIYQNAVNKANFVLSILKRDEDCADGGEAPQDFAPVTEKEADRR